MATVHVLFWCDTEDYIAPETHEAARVLAETFNALDAKATFKMVGEKVRVLEREGRRDVLSALADHAIGYHTDMHGSHPTPSEYTAELGWDEGIAEFMRREGPGVEDVRRVFGRTPVCYGQPGGSWCPQSYGAMRRWGIPVYLGMSTYVGLAQQPFWYSGVLSVSHMWEASARPGLNGAPDDLAQAQECFVKVADRLRSTGGTISIGLPPCEFVLKGVSEALNFGRGKQTARKDWESPALRSAEERDAAYAVFRQFVEFVLGQPEVQVVTPEDIRLAYADRAWSRPFSRDEVVELAQGCAEEATFQVLGDRSVSAGEAMCLLSAALLSWAEERELDVADIPRLTAGPTERIESTVEGGMLSSKALLGACRSVLEAVAEAGAVPNAVPVTEGVLSPADFLATIAAAVVSASEEGKVGERAEVRRGELTAEGYVDAHEMCWQWRIFPEGFTAWNLVELARLQCWTLKPALLQGRWVRLD